MSRNGGRQGPARPCACPRCRARARLPGGLVFEAHRLLYHSTLGLRVMQKRERRQPKTAPHRFNSPHRVSTGIVARPGRTRTRRISKHSAEAQSIQANLNFTASQNDSTQSTAPGSQRLQSIGCSGSTLPSNLLPRISKLT